jgi:polyphosphate glucokinase
LVTGAMEHRQFPSGPGLTPHDLVRELSPLTEDWEFSRVTIAYPGVVRDNRPVREPSGLGAGWIGFDYDTAFGCPLRILNDCAMQALGSDQGGRMLFLSLDKRLGSALVLDGLLQPTEFGRMTYRKKRTFDDYLGEGGLKRRGQKRWRRSVRDAAHRLARAMQVDYVVLGGEQAPRLSGVEFRGDVRIGDRQNVFLGGFRAWAPTTKGRRTMFRRW